MLQMINNGQLRVFEAFRSAGYYLQCIFNDPAKSAHLTSLSLEFTSCVSATCPVMPKCRTKGFMCTLLPLPE